MKQGLLLCAHGARDPQWSAPFEQVVARIRDAAPALVVELAFLEFMAPTLFEAGEHLIAAHCVTIDVVPLFLGSGGHVRKDLPALIDALGAAQPQVQWRLREAIGEIDTVIDAMAQAALRMAAEPR